MNGTPVDVDVARDGAEALEYLFSASRPALSVVLLDLKLPRVDGLDFLRRLRSDERTRKIPVVVLTSSGEERDLQQTARIGIERYIRKPVNFTEFREAARELARLYFSPSVGPEASAPS
jgi:CheY-like chemotaxis protein